MLNIYSGGFLSLTDLVATKKVLCDNEERLFYVESPPVSLYVCVCVRECCV